VSYIYIIIINSRFLSLQMKNTKCVLAKITTRLEHGDELRETVAFLIIIFNILYLSTQVVWFASEAAANTTSFTAHGFFNIDLQMFFSVGVF